MSGSVTTSNLLTSTEAAAKANGTVAAASTGASSATATASATASSALSSLAGNFNSFLTMLTTQLQNQDPSAPMDADQFTSEIATFAGVQQQVNTNTNLGQLISLTQNGQVTQSSSLVGQQANVNGSQIPLQSGSGSIGFTTSGAQPIAIAVTDSSGNTVRTVQETSASGANKWAWDGKDDSGNQLADGTYGIAVQTQSATGAVAAVPFTVNGTITGVTKSSSGGVEVQMGSDLVDMTDVNSVKQITAS